MKVKKVPTVVVVALATLLTLQVAVPQAQASWGAYLFQNSQPAQTTPPPDNSSVNPTQPGTNSGTTSTQPTDDRSRLLRDKNYRWSVYNNGGGTTTQPGQGSEQQPSSPQVPTEPIPPPQETGNGSDPAYGANQEALQLVTLVNQERAEQGLKPLAVHPGLTDLAVKKSQDMVENNYFSHTSPTYGSFYSMVYNAGIPFRQVGENLAKTRDIRKAHALLMASEGHRNNILNPNFTHIGIGVVHDQYGVVVTQLFIAQ